MPSEIEAQILEVDYYKVVKSLKKLGAKRVFPWRLFKIAAFFTCAAGDQRFSRVRDEGSGKITLTTKIIKKPFPDEYEINTDNSFEEAVEFVKSTNLSMKSFQQKLREKWIIPSHPEFHEIVFDIWPGLPMYLEIEGTKATDIDKAIKLLDLNPDNKRFANGGEIFTEYWGITAEEINDQTPSQTFKDVKRELGDRVRKNTDKLDKILKEQKAIVCKLGFSGLYGKHSKTSKSKYSTPSKIKSFIKEDTKKRAHMTRKLNKMLSSKNKKGGGSDELMLTQPMCLSGCKIVKT
jgi:adenylate cyclase class 2